MKDIFFTIVSVKDNEVHVSKPYKWNFSLSTLCDKARNISIENENVFVTIYKHFVAEPSTSRALYRFYNGKLVKF